MLILIMLLYLFTIVEVEASTDWPGFRGPNTDGTVQTGQKFAGSNGMLAVAWRSTLGPGYSSVSVAGKYAVTLFSNGADDFAIAYDAATGKELWRYKISSTYNGHDGSHDGPISTPVISGDSVFGYGAHGDLFGLNLATGKEMWSTNVAEKYKSVAPFYGFTASPLVSGGVVVVEIGAEAGKAIAGFDLKTGELKWTLGDDKINYQSPVLMKLNGKEIVAAVGDKKFFGIDPAAGKIVWEYAHKGEESPTASGAMVPVPAGEGRVLLKNKRDSSALVQVSAGSDGKYNVQPVWETGVLRNTYSIPVYYDGYFYGFNGRVLTCVNAKTGEVKWRSRGPDDGFMLLVDGNLVVQTKKGSLHIGPASPEGWKETAMIDLFKQVSWTPPIFAGGAIFARSQGEIAKVEWRTSSTASVTTAAPPAVPAGSSFHKFLAEVDQASDKKAAVDAFLKNIKSYPYVEWPDHVYFLFRGDATDVAIEGEMIGSRREDPMHRVQGTDLFWYMSRMEPDSQITYRFIKNYEERIADPYNVFKTKDFRDQDLSWFAMPGYKEPGHLKPASDSKKGKIEPGELKSKKYSGAVANYEVYLPAGYTNGQRLPIVYILDGEGARKEGLFQNTLDNMIGETIEPLIAVFITKVELGPAKPDDFEKEQEVYRDLLGSEFVPHVESKYPASDSPQDRAIIGHGYNGIDAFLLALRHPKMFGSIATQSLVKLEAEDQLLAKYMKTAQEMPLRIYTDWGSYDFRSLAEAWDMVEENRQFANDLRKRGYYPAGGEVHEGFGWVSWRNRTDRILAVLFPKKEPASSSAPGQK